MRCQHRLLRQMFKNLYSMRATPFLSLRDPDSTDASLQHISRPKWTRSGSRYGSGSGSGDLSQNRYSYAEPAYGTSANAYAYDPAMSSGHPTPMQDRPFTPPFVRSGSRPDSLASSRMLSMYGSQNDYDSVYQLWRQSGTPSSFKEHLEDGDAGFFDSRRGSNAVDLEKIEKYRSGGLEPSAKAAGPAAAYAALTKGEAGSKGPKDYRAVGLARYGRGKDEGMSTKKKWLIVLAIAAVIAIVVTAVVVPITTILLKDKSPKNDHSSPSSSSGSNSGSGSNSPNTKQLATSGTNGSTIDLGNESPSPTSTISAADGLRNHSTTRRKLRTTHLRSTKSLTLRKTEFLVSTSEDGL